MENMLEKKGTKVIVVIVLLLLLALLLVPFVVMAAHAYGSIIPELVVSKKITEWFWPEVFLISVVVWLALMILENVINESSTILNIATTLAILALAPYILIVGAAVIYGAAYAALAMIVIWCGIVGFLLSD